MFNYVLMICFKNLFIILSNLQLTPEHYTKTISIVLLERCLGNTITLLEQAKTLYFIHITNSHTCIVGKLNFKKQLLNFQFNKCIFLWASLFNHPATSRQKFVSISSLWACRSWMSFRDCTKSLSHSSILLQGFFLCEVAGNFYECCCVMY